MKNHLIEKKDIYNIVYYSQQEINVEKLFDQLYGMITYMLISPCMKLAFFIAHYPTFSLTSDKPYTYLALV